MNAIAFPTNVSQLARTITDQHDQLHTIELQNASLLLDKLSATVNIVGGDLHLTTEAGSYTVTAQALWHAFAGAEPTAIEAGLLLADSLVRMQALQQIQQLQVAFQRAYSQIQSLGEVPLPSYRLDSFVLQALDAYDGSPETTQLLARILKQDETVITAWACSLGKGPISVTTLPQDTQNGHRPKAQSTSIASATAPEEGTVEKAVVEPSARLQWSSEMEAQLIAAFETSQETSVKATIVAIAERFGWPVSAVHGRVYKLKLNERKRGHVQPHKREAESQEADQSSQDEQQREA